MVRLSRVRLTTYQQNKEKRYTDSKDHRKAGGKKRKKKNLAMMLARSKKFRANHYTKSASRVFLFLFLTNRKRLCRDVGCHTTNKS
jgi:hypothetical protein